MEQKILIAFDDSQNAMRAVEYTAKYITPASHITIFSVIQDTQALCEMNSPELTPYFKSQLGSFCILEDKKKELMVEAQQKARDLLLDAGFHAQKIQLKIEIKKNGVARDIVSEAHSGYDLIVLGRRGISAVKEFFLGSVSQKVFHSANDISVLVVN